MAQLSGVAGIGSTFLPPSLPPAFETVSAGSHVELLKKATCGTVGVQNNRLYLVMGASGTEVIVKRSFRSASAASSTSSGSLPPPALTRPAALLLQVPPPPGLGRAGGAVAHGLQHAGVSQLPGRPGRVRPGAAAGGLPGLLVEPRRSFRSWGSGLEFLRRTRTEAGDELISCFLLGVSGLVNLSVLSSFSVFFHQQAIKGILIHSAASV